MKQLVTVLFAVLLLGLTACVRNTEEVGTIVGRAYLLESQARWDATNIHIDDEPAIGAVVRLLQSKVDVPRNLGDYELSATTEVGEDGHYQFKVDEAGWYWVEIDIKSGPWGVKYVPGSGGFQVDTKGILVGPTLLLRHS